jgi:hypothetical protein
MIAMNNRQIWGGGRVFEGRVIPCILSITSQLTCNIIASLNIRVHSFSLTITGLNGSMFPAAGCASHSIPIYYTTTQQYSTDSLVAIAFYLEFCPSFVMPLNNRARLMKLCRLKAFSGVNGQIIAVPPGSNCPPPSSRHFVLLIVELGRCAYSFFNEKKNGVSCECRRKDS